MHFIKGEAELKSNGDLCDGKGDKCDSYVKLLIYNSIVFQTNIMKNILLPGRHSQSMQIWKLKCGTQIYLYLMI